MVIRSRDKDGSLPADNLLSVMQMQPGQQGILRRVAISDARVLRYLSQLTLNAWAQLKDWWKWRRLMDLLPWNC